LRSVVVVAASAFLLAGCGDKDTCDDLATAPGCAALPPDAGAAEPALVVATDRDRDVEIYALRTDGTGQRRLTTNPGRDYAPRWSRDGRLISFSSVRDGAPAEIWVMNADGSGQHQVTSSGRAASYPDWSPDGRRIVFQAARPDGGSDVHVINADGSGLQQLTTGDAYAMPRWSPDGSRIAMVRCTLPREDCLGTISTVSSEGGAVTVLAGTDLSAWPEWSPDGLRLAVASWRDMRDGQGTRQRLTVMNADGSGQAARTTTEADEWSPAWSRATGRIFFVRGGQIFSMRPEGSDVRRASVGVGYSFAVGAR
jgi:Tol biopolymer transport system component